MVSLLAFKNTKQTTKDSCGAYALACALKALRGQICLDTFQLDPTDVLQGYTVPIGQGVDGTDPAKLYEQTRLLRLMGATQFEYDPAGMWRNPPSALVSIARRAKLSVSVHIEAQTAQIFRQIMSTNSGFANGQSLYDLEVMLIKGMTVPIGHYLQPGSYTTANLGSNDVHLVLVNDTEHWIAVGQNELYDSAFPTVSRYKYDAQPSAFEYLDHIGRIVQAKVSGLWISLTP